MREEKRDVARDLRLMPCQAGGRSYYLDASAVRSVHRKEEWRLNWRSESPLGWIRHGGEEIPILDLARALGVAHTVVSDNAVLVETESGPKAWGVGGVGRVVMLPEERVLPIPEPCWTENSPPWLGLVTGEGTQALCVSPQHLGQVSHVAAAPQGRVESAGSHQPATGRAILFRAFLSGERARDVRFCLGFGQVAEFITAPRVVPVPAGRPWLLGLIVWRGRSIPVIDLGWGVAGKAAPAFETEDYLIVRANAAGALAAVTVAAKPEAVDLPFYCEREEDPRLAMPGWFRAAFRKDEGLVLTPDFAKILAAESA
jgi:chemotaxis signal transduction protein